MHVKPWQMPASFIGRSIYLRFCGAAILIYVAFPVCKAYYLGSVFSLVESCGDNLNISDPFFEALAHLLSHLEDSASPYNTFSKAVADNLAFGIVLCNVSLSQNQCTTCISELVNRVQYVCPLSSSVQMNALYQCFLRFEKHDFSQGVRASVLPKNHRILLSCDHIITNFVPSSFIYYYEDLSRVLNVVAQGEDYMSLQIGQIMARSFCYSTQNNKTCRACQRALVMHLLDSCRMSAAGVVTTPDCCIEFFALDSVSLGPSSMHGVPSVSNTSPTVFDNIKATKTGKALAISWGLSFTFLIVLAVVILIFLCGYIQRGSLPATDLECINASPIFFTFKELQLATKDFSLENKLGQGGMGVVYKGVLVDGSEVAVKEIVAASQHRKREFINEVTLVSRIQHRNLVKLRGCCIEGSKRLLVYDYLKNKSLDQHIFNLNSHRCLSWTSRMEILMGVARGLAYLHGECAECIVHRDIKASNILLDSNFEPKIADFGLLKLVKNGRSSDAQVVGTIGYMAPEYALHGKLTEKVDVFSYGVLALEVMSGDAIISPVFSANNGCLLSKAWTLYRENIIEDFVDPSLLGNLCLSEARRVIGIALACLQPDQNKRPTMNKVAFMLAQGEWILYDLLKPEAFGVPEHVPQS